MVYEQSRARSCPHEILAMLAFDPHEGGRWKRERMTVKGSLYCRSVSLRHGPISHVRRGQKESVPRHCVM